jgi:phosphatidylinositol 4-kinase A
MMGESRLCRLIINFLCSYGRLVHIDFGFILEISPGGNMGFESAHFKLSHEMTQLLDPSGTMKSDTWNQFLR